MAARKLETSFSGTGPLQALQQQLKEGRLGKKKKKKTCEIHFPAFQKAPLKWGMWGAA